MPAKKISINVALTSLAKALEKQGLTEASEGVEGVIQDILRNPFNRANRTQGAPSSPAYPVGGGPGGADEEYRREVGMVPRDKIPMVDYALQHPLLGKIIREVGAIPEDKLRLVEYAMKNYPKELLDKLQETMTDGIGAPLSAGGAKKNYEYVSGVGMVDVEKVPVVNYALQKIPQEYKKPLIEIFQSGLKPQRAKYAFCAQHLLKLSEEIKSKGYEKLGERLASASVDFLLKNAGTKDFHMVPSLEEIYQRGKEHDHFEADLKLLIGAYEGIVGILKDFDKKYKETVMKDIDKEHKDVDTVANKTVSLIRQTDQTVENAIEKIRGK